MKVQEIIKSVGSNMGEIGFKAKKCSPEILIVFGVVGTVASTIMACKATTKVGKIVEDTKKDLDTIHEAVDKGETNAGEEYTHEDSKKDLTIIYVQTGVKLAKLYAPAIALGALSLTGIITSNQILRKRNMALAAAYATVDKGFKTYRGRVIERFGEGVDRELKDGVKAKKVEVIETDPETGEEKKVKKKQYVADPLNTNMYARWFDQYTLDEDGNRVINDCWENNNTFNLMFLRSRERYANDLLVVKKRLFLNEVYDMLGLPPTKAGQIVGWKLDPKNNNVGDNYISFGLYDGNPTYMDTDDPNPAILLNFNVDGNVWDDMTE